jgi:DNA-binding CsgD family transcriptional regulator
MHPLRYLFRRLIPPPQQGVFQIDPDLERALKALARQEGQPVEQVAADLLTAALDYRRQAQEKLALYWRLSPRERQVIALACQNLNTGQIAARLSISAHTVRSHLRNSLSKMELDGQTQMRRHFANWDFSGCEKDPERMPRLLVRRPSPQESSARSTSWRSRLKRIFNQ